MQSQSIVGDGDNRAENDYYPTPPYITKALLDREVFVGYIHEPACGAGDMAEVIREYYPGEVYSSDLIDRGYGDGGVDFLSNYGRDTWYVTNNVITNPPYCLALEFARHALEIITEGGKVALLLKLSFLEGVKRKQFLETSGLKTVYVFSKRIRLDANEITGKTSGGMIAFAWFVWHKGYKGDAVIKWI